MTPPNPRCLPTALALLGVLCVASPAEAGGRIHRIQGTDENRLGWSVAALPDLDGDGVADFAAGAPSGLVDPAPFVRVYSGADASVIHDIPGAPGTFFGHALASAGDVDGDGIGDLLVSDAGDAAAATSAWVYSGADASVIHTFTGTAGQRFGWDVAGLGDLDGDGRADFAIAAFRDGTSGDDAGAVYIHSGLDGSLLHTFLGAGADAFLGRAVATAGLVDGDDVPDILLGASNIVEVRSGADFSLLVSVTDGPASSGFGSAVAAAGDLDGDGTGDFLTGAPSHNASGPDFANGIVRLHSGVDGAVIDSWTGANEQEVGTVVAGGHDWDGDGTDDIFFSSTDDLSNGNGGWEARSGATGARLEADDAFWLSWGTGVDLQWGYAMDVLPDVNGDGSPDILMGCRPAGDPPQVSVIAQRPTLDLGGASTTVATAPQLSVDSLAFVSSPVTVELTDAPPLTPTLLWGSFATTPFDALGGTVHAAPASVQLLFVTNAQGELQLATEMPPLPIQFAWPTDAELYVQFVVADPSVPGGLTLSNAVKLAADCCI